MQYHEKEAQKYTHNKTAPRTLCCYHKPYLWLLTGSCPLVLMVNFPTSCSVLKIPFTNLSGSRFVARSVVNISLNAPNQEHFLLVLTAPRAPLLCMNPCALHALLQPGLEVPGT